MILNEASKNALVLDKTNQFTIASQIALNLQGEWDAVDGYMKLIPFLEMYNDIESINQIREIVSDEKNHAERLRGILLKYDNGIPTSKD